MKINTKDGNLIYIKHYRYPEVHPNEVKSQLNRMLAQGIIQHFNLR